MDDSRTSNRFAVHLPTRVTGNSGEHQFNGTAENVSASGAYLVLDSQLQVGSPVTFEMRIPGDVIGSSKDVTVHCEGRVMRADDKDGKNGVACVIDTYEFEREEQGK